MIMKVDVVPEMEVGDAFRALGLKPRTDRWLQQQSVFPTNLRKNRRGKPSKFIATSDLIRALRQEHPDWPRWKVWEFECKVRNVADPGYLCVLLVEACRPDYELLRAALFFALDTGSGFLDGFLSRRGRPQGSGIYFCCDLANYVLRRVKSRMKLRDVRLGAELFLNQNISIGQLWAAQKEVVASWPTAARTQKRPIYNGALLLGKRTGENFAVSLSGWLPKLRRFSSPAYANFMVRRPSCFAGFKGSVFPLALVLDAGFKSIPLQLMDVPGIQGILKRAGETCFDGRSSSNYTDKKEDLAELVREVETLASKRQKGTTMVATIRSVLKAWHYRVNWDTEMELRGHRREGAVPLTAGQVARIFGESTRKSAALKPARPVRLGKPEIL